MSSADNLDDSDALETDASGTPPDSPTTCGMCFDFGRDIFKELEEWDTREPRPFSDFIQSAEDGCYKCAIVRTAVEGFCQIRDPSRANVSFVKGPRIKVSGNIKGKRRPEAVFLDLYLSRERECHSASSPLNRCPLNSLAGLTPG